MNKLIKKLSLITLIILGFSNLFFAQDAVTKALDLINKSLILNDYDRAYNYSKFVINYYDGDEIPSDVAFTVSNAISQRANNLVIQEKWDDVLKMDEELKSSPENIKAALTPALAKTNAHFKEIEEEKQRKIEAEAKAKAEQERLQKEADELAKKEAENKRLQDFYEEQRRIAQENEARLRNQEQALQRKQRQEDLEREIQQYELQRQMEEKKIALEEKRLAADEEYRQQMNQMFTEMNQNTTETISKVSRNSKVMLFVILIIVGFFVFLIIFVVFVSIRQARNHQEQLKDTIMIMQAQSLKSANMITDSLPLLLQMQTLSLQGNQFNNQNSTLALEDKSTDSKDEKAVISELINDCKKYGKQIDEVSGRKNVSMRVADLVVKISQQLDYSEYDCIIFYAAALVYDIGLLNVDPGILKSGTLSEAQFKQVQAHTTQGKNMLFFVDKKYKQVFEDAVSKHHENIDGTGYPNQLKGDEIPYIAKVLRVAESYIALISNRSYKNILDRDSAINELRNYPTHYDEKIVDALDEII